MGPRDGLSVDWHCHSTWSDGRATVAEAVRRAAARGVTLGIADHGLRDNRRLGTPSQLASYVDDLRRYPVLRGMEISVGDVPGDVAGAETDVRLAELDYLIASLHIIQVPEGPVHATRYLNYRAGLYPRYRPTLARYNRRGYFDSWLRAFEATVRHRPVKILGHFCLLPELANDEGIVDLSRDPEPDAVAAEWLDATIELCCRYDVAIELNSKSRVPHESFVVRALEKGARFSLGSDAHQLHRVADLSYGRYLVSRLNIPRHRLLSVANIRPAAEESAAG